MSNNLDSDQARLFVGPDLFPNWLQNLSVGDTSRQRRVNENFVNGPVHAISALNIRGESRISEKGLRLFKGVGAHFASLILSHFS